MWTSLKKQMRESANQRNETILKEVTISERENCAWMSKRNSEDQSVEIIKKKNEKKARKVLKVEGHVVVMWRSSQKKKNKFNCALTVDEVDVQAV